MAGRRHQEQQDGTIAALVVAPGGGAGASEHPAGENGYPAARDWGGCVRVPGKLGGNRRCRAASTVDPPADASRPPPKHRRRNDTTDSEGPQRPPLRRIRVVLAADAAKELHVDLPR